MAPHHAGVVTCVAVLLLTRVAGRKCGVGGIRAHHERDVVALEQNSSQRLPCFLLDRELLSVVKDKVHVLVKPLQDMQGNRWNSTESAKEKCDTNHYEYMQAQQLCPHANTSHAHEYSRGAHTRASTASLSCMQQASTRLMSKRDTCVWIASE